MLNGFEFQKISKSELPLSWQGEGVLEEFEKFIQDNWQQRAIFYSDGQVTSRQQFIDFDKKNAIKLQNYIGTIIFKGEQLNIFPKIFKEDEDDHDASKLRIEELIDNLVIWLEYCDRLNFPFVTTKSELSGSENLLELFITIYVHYVKAAIERQHFYQYEDIVETGSFIKGKINIGDYICNKYPSGAYHKIEYVYSSFVFDNALNRIIKCTCSMLMNLTKQESNRRLLRNILIKLSDVSSINCTPYDCDNVHLSILHFNYRIILSMSKMFLLNKVNTNRMGYTDSFCFLFPAELLFEGFVGGFLKTMFSDKGKVTTQASGNYLAELVVDGEIIGDAFKLKEDILIEYEDTIVVLDTKYKEIDSFEKIRENKKLKISDNDIKQMAVYAVRRGAKKLFLIYPLRKNEEPESIEIRYDIILDSKKAGMKIPLEILKVPFFFEKDNDTTKQVLIDILKKSIFK